MKENDITNNRIFAELILVIVAIALMFVGLISCNSSRRSTKHFTKALTINRTATAGNCANTFPYKTEVTERTNTVYLKGDEIVIHDTITEYLDNNKVVKYPIKYITRIDTIRKDSIITINADGGPELAQCQDLLEQAAKDKQKAIEDKIKAETNEKSAKKSKLGWIIAFIMLAIVFIAPKIIKLIK